MRKGLSFRAKARNLIHAELVRFLRRHGGVEMTGGDDNRMARRHSER